MAGGGRECRGRRGGVLAERLRPMIPGTAGATPENTVATTAGTTAKTTVGTMAGTLTAQSMGATLAWTIAETTAETTANTPALSIAGTKASSTARTMNRSVSGTMASSMAETTARSMAENTCLSMAGTKANIMGDPKALSIAGTGALSTAGTTALSIAGTTARSVAVTIGRSVAGTTGMSMTGTTDSSMAMTMASSFAGAKALNAAATMARSTAGTTARCTARTTARRTATCWDVLSSRPLLLLLLLIVHAVDAVPATKEPTLTRTQFLQKLLEGYDSRVPPNFDNNTPTVVEADMFISSFDSISESTMDYVVSIFMRQMWHDARLDFRHLSNESVLSLDARLADNLWLPDLFFTNEKKAYFHDVTKPNRFIRLYNNGTVYYSMRVSLTVSCPMKLHKFPLDTQVCALQMESYAYTLDRLVLQWRPDEPVEFNDELELPQFKLSGFNLKDCTKHYHTGSFTCLQVDFILERDIGFYMIQTYIPSALVVILSWVSFWINIDAIPARISLGVLTILTMTTQSSGSRQSLPRVSYIKAIDIWMTMCLLFVFAALLEFAIVNVLNRKEIRRMVTMRRTRARTRADKVAASRTFHDPGAEDLMEDGAASRQETYIRDPYGKQRARNVDKVARKLFPIVFVGFNVVYWITYALWTPNPIPTVINSFR